MKRNIFLFTIMIVVLAALPLAAAAQDQPVDPQVVVAGSGSIEAEGTGRARIVGTGTATISGTGKLVIVDLRRDAEINVQGEGTCVEKTLDGDTYKLVCRGWSGSATVTDNSSGFRLKLVGSEVNLSATGTGKVRLNGSGTYSLFDSEGNPVSNGIWRERGIKLYLGNAQ